MMASLSHTFGFASERRQLWVVEIDQGGINWTPIAYCHSKEQAEAQASHIPQGKPVRVREYGTVSNLAAALLRSG